MGIEMYVHGFFFMSVTANAHRRRSSVPNRAAPSIAALLACKLVLRWYRGRGTRASPPLLLLGQLPTLRLLLTTERGTNRECPRSSSSNRTSR
jgi:hypothetical protein